VKNKLLRLLLPLLLAAACAVFLGAAAYAAQDGIIPPAPPAPQTPAQPAGPPPVGGGAGTQDPNITFNINSSGSDTVRIIVLMTVLTVLPSILLMMTCFTRIVIVFSLMRQAMGLQQTPPNQVLVGMALFLTFFVMSPVITDINENAYRPYSDGEISASEFLDRAETPLKTFMYNQITDDENITLFLNLANKERPATIEEYTMDVVVPAFITSEVKRAFTIGFLLFIPFLLIDMVVSSALMAMGMMMLPPVTVSLPFKLMLFILVDGWGLLIRTLVASYNV
jgi:flagellar biosynthetic protein FliP